MKFVPYVIIVILCVVIGVLMFKPKLPVYQNPALAIPVAAQNPFVGTWTSTFSLASTITLRADGTGCTYGFVFKEENIKWHAEGDKVLIDSWPNTDDSSIPKLMPDGKALMCGGDTYYKQKE